jgi:hypothetical protein
MAYVRSRRCATGRWVSMVKSAAVTSRRAPARAHNSFRLESPEELSLSYHHAGTIRTPVANQAIIDARYESWIKRPYVVNTLDRHRRSAYRLT